VFCTVHIHIIVAGAVNSGFISAIVELHRRLLATERCLALSRRCHSQFSAFMSVRKTRTRDWGTEPGVDSHVLTIIIKRTFFWCDIIKPLLSCAGIAYLETRKVS
jgi:hypothetical protein